MVRARIDALRLAGARDDARSNVSRLGSLTTQPETAYVLAALDLAEPQPVWATVIERLRTAAAAEGTAGRARAALIYALAQSGDVPGARAELVKIDTAARPYPLLPNLHAFLDASGDKGRPAASASASSRAPAKTPESAPAAPPAPAPQAAVGAAGAGDSDPRNAMQNAALAIKRADFARARQIYQSIVDRNPNDSEAVSGLGDVARLQGDSLGAIASYKRAIAINPSYLPALLGLADTEWVRGDRTSATKTYKDVVDRFPEGTYPAYVSKRIEGASAPAPGAAEPSAPAEPEEHTE
jgi:tetratricopeptide (TPR) repeat protein